MYNKYKSMMLCKSESVERSPNVSCPFRLDAQQQWLRNVLTSFRESQLIVVDTSDL